MMENSSVSRNEALNKLKEFGITNEKVYLIALVLLIEIIWVDGQAQESELAILEDYLEEYVDHFNNLVGCKILRLEDAKEFVRPYIEKRPSSDELCLLRTCVKPVLFPSDKQQCEKIKDELLFVCMDIAAIATTQYPYDNDGRFNPDEKRCFFNIMESIS
ncbi:MAG: hypothetical protein D3914_07875 [Candidatus Electrothrix sp. LOE2]|nr:hypothetical protein [Candidatus Electrothrix sp. LOE2]